MKFKRRTVLLFVILAVTLAALIVTMQLSEQSLDIRERAAGNGSEIRLTGVNPTSVSFGQTFTMDIVVDPKGSQVVGADIHLTFNKSLVTLTNITNKTGHNLKTYVPLGSSNTFDATAIRNAANTSGVLIFGAVGFDSGASSVTSPQTAAFTLATLTFQAKSTAGSAAFGFSAIGTSTIDTNLAVAGQNTDQLSSVVGTSVTIAATATNTPVPSATRTPSPTATKTPTPTATKIPTPTATKTPTPTVTRTPTPTATKTPTPTRTPTPYPCPRGPLGNLDCAANACIDTGDFELFRQAFGKQVSTLNIPVGRHTPNLLQDSSPIIDTGDYGIFVNKFGTCQ